MSKYIGINENMISTKMLFYQLYQLTGS